MDIKNIPINELKPYKSNPKAHPKDQIDKIAKSIQEFGWLVPIVIDKNKNIIAGHGRYLAAKKLDLEDVPVIEAKKLNKAQIKTFRIADNRLAESKWLDDYLAQELKELQDLNLNLDMELTGFDYSRIEKLIELDEEKNLEELIAREEEWNAANDLAEKIIRQATAHIENIAKNNPRELNNALMVIVNKGQGNDVLFLIDPNTKDVVQELKRYMAAGEPSPLEKLTESVWI